MFLFFAVDFTFLGIVLSFQDFSGSKLLEIVKDLEQTHEIVKLFRDILNVVAPRVALITETNVPHDENISYFGNGHDEAQMVYNFALPPLVLHSFYTENATILSTWAKNLKRVSNTATFFNFLDSHDGIGLMAVKNILGKEDIDYMIERVEKRG